MTQVNILEARNRLSALIKAAESGEVVVIANRGRPVARLVAVRPPSRTSGIADWLAEHPLPAHARRSSADIDVDVLEARAGWD